MKEINLDIKTTKVETKVRKLRSSMKREMISDLIISNSFNIEEFEKSILSELRRDRIKNKIIRVFKNDNK